MEVGAVRQSGSAEGCRTDLLMVLVTPFPLSTTLRLAPSSRLTSLLVTPLSKVVGHGVASNPVERGKGGVEKKLLHGKCWANLCTKLLSGVFLPFREQTPLL